MPSQRAVEIAAPIAAITRVCAQSDKTYGAKQVRADLLSLRKRQVLAGSRV
jgi:hypothetical protein